MSEVNADAADGDIRAILQTEGGDEAGEEQRGILSAHGEVLHAAQIEGNALQALVVVTYELVALVSGILSNVQYPLGQHELGGMRATARLKGSADGGHRIVPVRFGKVVTQINCAPAASYTRGE